MKSTIFSKKRLGSYAKSFCVHSFVNPFFLVVFFAYRLFGFGFIGFRDDWSIGWCVALFILYSIVGFGCYRLWLYMTKGFCPLFIVLFIGTIFYIGGNIYYGNEKGSDRLMYFFIFIMVQELFDILRRGFGHGNQWSEMNELDKYFKSKKPGAGKIFKDNGKFGILGFISFSAVSLLLFANTYSISNKVQDEGRLGISVLLTHILCYLLGRQYKIFDQYFLCEKISGEVFSIKFFNKGRINTEFRIICWFVLINFVGCFCWSLLMVPKGKPVALITTVLIDKYLIIDLGAGGWFGGCLIGTWVLMRVLDELKKKQIFIEQ